MSRLNVMKKEGSRVVHRPMWGDRTACNQSGWRMAWETWDARLQNGLPIVPATMRLCKKCFPRARKTG